jgi:phospholipase C
MPVQERGIRPARALPYELDASGHVQLGDGSVRIDLANSGAHAAVFQVRSGNPAHDPRSFTLGPGTQLSGVWSVAGIGATSYDLSVYGPNGFLRAFKGSVLPSASRLVVHTAYDRQTNHLTLTIGNDGAHGVTVDVLDHYTGKVRSENVAVGDSVSRRWELEPFGGWYDFVITVEHDTVFTCQVAGHLETGDDSISDPAMA